MPSSPAFKDKIKQEEMMIKLEPMLQEDFDRVIETDIREYAADHVRNGNWPEEGSLERSRKEFESLLPQGVRTPDQYLWSLLDGDNKVGFIWVQVKEGKAFIYDFRIDEEYRGKGYGKQSLAAMDEKLRSMNVDSVALHVFGDNITAQELYKKMGFEITGMHMQKKYR
jgi:ribosomal protein S18 acetylase RimI-like enzyme